MSKSENAQGSSDPPKAPTRAPAPTARGGKIVEYPAGPEIQVARPARPRKRHWAIALSFVLVVVAPGLAITTYMYAVAHDQYASRVAFSIRGQENSSPISFLGALSQTVTIGGTDAEIIYEFVRSQKMVEAVLEKLPLFEIFNVPEHDIVFRLGEDRSIEDVVDYWNWMTSVSFDGATGIVQFEARAFKAEDAEAITSFVLEESTRIVNEISLQAREDAVSVARGVLAQAEERLRMVRRNIRAFRDTEQELDPQENARASLGLVATLREDLAEAQVELDSYLSLVGPQGPRAQSIRQRIDSLQQRIAQERERMATGSQDPDSSDRPFSELMSDYEELSVELEFAENAYVSALASFENAQVDARRQTRFLSPHIQPTRSVEPQYPQRALIAIGAVVVLAVAWSVLILIIYNVRDRR